MQEVPTTDVQHAVAQTSGHEALQRGLESRASAMGAVAKTDENLGHVASGPTVTATGEVMTPRDRQAELEYRQVHGEPSHD
jgi:ABC-type taurine transport system substrate-binding protein